MRMLHGAPMISSALRITICVVALAGLGWSVALKTGVLHHDDKVGQYYWAAEQHVVSFQRCVKPRHDELRVFSQSVPPPLAFDLIVYNVNQAPPTLMPVANSDAGGGLLFHCPVNLLVLIFALTSTLTAVPLARRLRRRRSGCCVRCGYDMRGTPARCPECC
jgi:hypothetical protein